MRLGLMAALYLVLGAGSFAAPALDRPQLVIFRVGGPAGDVRYSLVAVRPDGTTIRLLRTGGERAPWRPALFERASWAPDGRRLAFTAERGRRLASCARDIHMMRADGSRPRRLTSGGRSFHPVWAPGGRRIFFARGPSGFCSSQTAAIWSMRPDGSDQRRLTGAVTGRYDVPGSFSPDGRTLAFTRGTFAQPGDGGRLANTREVWTVRRDGSGARRLAERAADPAFSPNGTRIAFASDRDENGELSYGDRVLFANELYVMRADGSSPRRLTRTRARSEDQPSWLPSGERIAYQRGRVTGNAQGTVVMQVNGDGSCPTPILADPRLRSWYAAPAWRPGNARRGDGPLTC